MKKTAVFLISTILACAQGSVRQSTDKVSDNPPVYLVSAYFTGDPTTGAVPTTAIQKLAPLQGYRVIVVETIPGSPTPTNNYNLKILDSAGVDALGGAASAVSNSAPQSFSGSPTAAPLFGTFNVSITGQSVAGAQGTVFIYLAPITAVIGLTPSAPSFPSQGANLVFASPCGSTGSPGFRATCSADIIPINLASSANGGVSATLASANGGTGWVGVKLAADGVTNDVPALQTAINLLSAGAGGTILLPPGNILLSGSGTELLKFPGPGIVSLVGAGMNTTILLVASSVPGSTEVIHIAPSTVATVGMRLQDFAIVPQSGTPASNAIDVDTTSHGISELLINHLFIGALGGHAIVSTNPSLTDGFFNSKIENCLTFNGVKLNRLGDRVEFRSNTFTGLNIGVEVVSWVPGAANTIIEGNTFVNTGAFIKTGDFQFGTWILNNIFETVNGVTGSNGAVIDIDGGTNLGQDLHIINNRISTAASASPTLNGIRVNLAKGTFISRNTFQRNNAGPASITITASAIDTWIDPESYSPNTDKFPITWTDAGTFTTVVQRCEPYILNGSSLTSATNTQTFNLFTHGRNSVVYGVQLQVPTAFTAAALNTLQVSLGDTCCSTTFYTPLQSVTTVGAVFRNLPPTTWTTQFASTISATFTGTYGAGGNFSTNPVSGQIELDVCWGLTPMTGQQ